MRPWRRSQSSSTRPWVILVKEVIVLVEVMVMLEIMH